MIAWGCGLRKGEHGKGTAEGCWLEVSKQKVVVDVEGSEYAIHDSIAHSSKKEKER